MEQADPSTDYERDSTVRCRQLVVSKQKGGKTGDETTETNILFLSAVANFQGHVLKKEKSIKSYGRKNEEINKRNKTIKR